MYQSNDNGKEILASILGYYQFKTLNAVHIKIKFNNQGLSLDFLGIIESTLKSLSILRILNLLLLSV